MEREETGNAAVLMAAIDKAHPGAALEQVCRAQELAETLVGPKGSPELHELRQGLFQVAECMRALVPALAAAKGLVAKNEYLLR